MAGRKISVFGFERGRRRVWGGVGVGGGVGRDVCAGVNSETGVGGLGVADRLSKGGGSAGLLTESPMKAVSEPFGAGGGADVLIILILSPQTQAISNMTRHKSFLCRAKRF